MYSWWNGVHPMLGRSHPTLGLAPLSQGLSFSSGQTSDNGYQGDGLGQVPWTIEMVVPTQFFGKQDVQKVF